MAFSSFPTMPLSTKRQTALFKARIALLEHEKGRPKQAEHLLRGKLSIRVVAERCSLKKSIVGRISKCTKSNDSDALFDLLNPVKIRPGRSPVWNRSEANQFNARLIYASSVRVT